MKITLATKLTKFKHHVYDKRRKFPKIFLTFPLIAESTKQKNEKKSPIHSKSKYSHLRVQTVKGRQKNTPV